jgi:hypothetical protein
LLEVEFEEAFAEEEVLSLVDDSSHIQFDDCSHEFSSEGLDRVSVKDLSNVHDFCVIITFWAKQGPQKFCKCVYCQT